MVNMQMVHELRIIFDHINMPCDLASVFKNDLQKCFL